MDLVILCWFAGCDRLLVLDIVNSVGMIISLVMNVRVRCAVYWF